MIAVELVMLPAYDYHQFNVLSNFTWLTQQKLAVSFMP